MQFEPFPDAKKSLRENTSAMLSEWKQKMEGYYKKNICNFEEGDNPHKISRVKL